MVLSAYALFLFGYFHHWRDLTLSFPVLVTEQTLNSTGLSVDIEDLIFPTGQRRVTFIHILCFVLIPGEFNIIKIVIMFPRIVLSIFIFIYFNLTCVLLIYLVIIHYIVTIRILLLAQPTHDSLMPKGIGHWNVVVLVETTPNFHYVQLPLP